MRKLYSALALVAAAFAPMGSAQTPATGPYKVLKTAKVGGEGGWDYIYADPAGRRLYIPRRGTPPGTDPAIATRLSIYNLDTLELVSEIADVGGQGTAVDPKSSHGFTSSKPVSMFDTKTMKLIKTIDVATDARPDGIYFDGFNDLKRFVDQFKERTSTDVLRVHLPARATDDERRIMAESGAVTV